MFINYPHRKQTVPFRIFVPNLITTIAMCCGLASLHYSLKGDWDRAMYAIILSAVFDGLDGRAARLLKVTSPFGEVLDSLSDFLSFGVAPAVLLYEWMLKKQDVYGLGLVAVTTFVLCSAMRLARFTAAAGKKPGATPTPEEQRDAIVKAKFFVGLATPAAAAAVMVPVMLTYSKILGEYIRPVVGMEMPSATSPTLARTDSPTQLDGQLMALFVVVYTLLIAFWMISRLPMFSFKKLRVSKRAAVPILVCVGAVVVLAVRDLWLMMAGLALVYLCTMPLSVAAYKRLMSRPAQQVVAELKTRPVAMPKSGV